MSFRWRAAFCGILCAALSVGCGKNSDQEEPEAAAKRAAGKPVFTPLGLGDIANQPLNRPPEPRGQGNNLADLPTGKQTLAGVPFVIGKSYVQVGSKRFTGKPLLVRGIAVGRSVKRLHFLHAASFSGIHRNDGSGQRDGDVIGSYVVHYTDGSKAEVPIVYGQDLRDWWNWDQSKPTSAAKVGWTGTNTYASRFGIGVRLYVSSWDNPHPEKRIATIDVQSENSLSAPLCVAITAEGK